MNYREALRTGEEYLKSCRISEAALDAWYLMEYCTGMSRAQYFLRQEDEISSEKGVQYKELVEKRGTHIPLQHLTGYQPFMGLEFAVNEHVLIPRQDTEILVEEALKKIVPGDKVLDMCTGSGCIAVSLAVMAEKIRVYAADISAEALKVAERNAQRHQAEVTFMESDLFEHAEGVFDCIISNPPYIKSAEIPELMPEVREHEPLSALDGREDGLYFYRKIINGAKAYLKPSGWLFFEIGYDQGEAVSGMMRCAGYEKIEIKKDLAGLNRVVLGQRR